MICWLAIRINGRDPVTRAVVPAATDIDRPAMTQASIPDVVEQVEHNAEVPVSIVWLKVTAVSGIGTHPRMLWPRQSWLRVQAPVTGVCPAMAVQVALPLMFRQTKSTSTPLCVPVVAQLSLKPPHAEVAANACGFSRSASRPSGTYAGRFRSHPSP